MKKSLLAVAALGAFASAAQAQSSVTVYGILDVGYVASNYNGTSITANAANVNNAGSGSTGGLNGKQITSGFGQSAESTSRIGFKGSEDLGGGTSALFTIELGLSPNSNGAATSGDSAAKTLVSTPAAWGQNNRQTFVGLKKNGIGTATIGTQYTPIFDVGAQTDAAGFNNLIGNMVYSGSLQSSTGSYNQGLAPYSGATANQNLNAANGAFTTRVSNALKFQSDNFAGFTGQLFYAQANQTNAITSSQGASANGGNAGGTNNNTVWGVNGNYVWNKLQVVAAYQGIKSYNPAAYATQTFATSTFAAGTADSFGNNMSDQQGYAAAVYDFGILKTYLQYVNRKGTSLMDSSYTSTRSATQLGVKGNLTPTITAYATMGAGNSAYYGQSLATNKFRGYQVGVDYYLSKRTNLYVAGGGVNQSGNGSAALASTANGTNAAGTNAGMTGVSGSNYAVGVRHTF
jgi:predicted porin